MMYETGQGTEQDYGQALKWYELAAKKNHVRAKDKLEALKFKISFNKGSCAAAIGN